MTTLVLKRCFFARAVALGAVVIAMFAGTAIAHAATAPSGPFLLDAVRTDSPPPLEPSLTATQWQKAHGVTLDWDFTFHRPAKEKTTAYLLYDDKYIYCEVVAEQKTPVVATQHSNDVGDDLDDNAAVQFWPSGATGIRYKFTANALGTRYQESSENDSYAPHWDAVGHIGGGGFTVMMRIPLNVMRGDGRTQWRFNVQRLRQQTGELFMWATDPNATEDDQGQYAGYLNGMAGISSSARTQSRLAIYGLGALGSKAAGGYTSRVGVDLALPITRTTSLLATAHPDYSNVELDQRAIQPTEFRRVIQEVRPFFTQGASYYNRFDQIGNVANIMLNTPSVPTPRFGGAIEGHQGGVGFAALNSVGQTTTDAADALFWTSADKRFVTGYQRVAVAQGGFYDIAQAGTFRYDSLRGLFAYASYGADRGTNVTDPALGNWSETGIGLYAPGSRISAAAKKIGALYSPAAGIVDHSDIAGYAVEASRQFAMATGAWLRSIDVTGDLERYHGATVGLDQADQTANVTFSTRNLFTLSAGTGSHFLVGQDGFGGIFDENQISLAYDQAGSAPLSATTGAGRFGNGFLKTRSLQAAFHIGSRGLLDAESDGSRYAPDGGDVAEQSLLRIAFTMEMTKDDSVTAGVRRVTGAALGVGGGIQVGPGSNVSFAIHHRAGSSELYVVYGDPNATSTYPVLTAKLIEYIGAQKGS